jgi:2-keto-3-deoxy-L-rhamnonate aldolase RhmA
MVRVPTASKDFIGRALDSGADGILVPQVSSVEEARQAVAQALYPPRGVRGAAFYARTYEYTRQSGWDALDREQDDVVIGVMLETPQAIEQARAISETAGVDFVLLGAGDLSVALGRGDDSRSALAAAVASIGALARESNVPFGASAVDPDTAAPYLRAGYRVIVVGLLPLLLRSATHLCAGINQARA